MTPHEYLWTQFCNTEYSKNEYACNKTELIFLRMAKLLCWLKKIAMSQPIVNVLSKFFLNSTMVDIWKFWLNRPSQLINKCRSNWHPSPKTRLNFLVGGWWVCEPLLVFCLDSELNNKLGSNLILCSRTCKKSGTRELRNPVPWHFLSVDILVKISFLMG